MTTAAHSVAFPRITPLSAEPYLKFKSGVVEVCDAGQVFVFGGRWVGAVAISKQVFLTTELRLNRYIDSTLFGEFLSCLSTQGTEVISFPFRCPAVWRTRLTSEKMRALWVREYLDVAGGFLFREPLPLSLNPRLALPVASTAEFAAGAWLEIDQLLQAFTELEGAIGEDIAEKLRHLARRWELAWSKCLFNHGPVAGETAAWVARCDRAWWGVVRAYLDPLGYSPNNSTLARML